MDDALATALGAAYQKFQVGGDRAGAIASLKEFLSTTQPILTDAAKQHVADINALFKARGPCCHISKVQLDLLTEALKGA